MLVQIEGGLLGEVGSTSGDAEVVLLCIAMQMGLFDGLRRQYRQLCDGDMAARV